MTRPRTTEAHDQISFKTYLTNIIRFMSTTVFDIIPQTMGMVFFNFSKSEDSLSLLGFLISSFYFFFCISFNHSEIINLKSGIHFSKRQFRRLNTKVAQCVATNLVFFCVSVCFAFLSRVFFGLVGLEGAFLDSVSRYVPIYGVLVGTGFMLANICRGNLACIDSQAS